MKLKQLFREDDESHFPKLAVHPTVVDLPFEIPHYKWQLDYKIPMHSYTRGAGSETVHEIGMPSIDSVVSDIIRAGSAKLLPEKFAMYAFFEDPAPEFKVVEKQLSPRQEEEPEFHIDDSFGGDIGSIAIIMSHLNKRVTLIHGIYAGNDGKEFTVYFNDAINTKLNKLFDDTLAIINRKLAEPRR